MISRYLVAATIGMTTTTALLWTMQFLIEQTEVASTAPETRGSLDLVRVPRDEKPPRTRERPPQRIDPPVVTPPQRSLTNNQHTGAVIGVRTQVPNPRPHFSQPTALPRADGPLVSVINVQPEYPLIAVDRGIEGHVVVEFDVTEFGTVENVRVLESSHSVFEKPAIAAAERSRYVPRVVDGVPQVSRNIRKLYTFEMEE